MSDRPDDGQATSARVITVLAGPLPGAAIVADLDPDHCLADRGPDSERAAEVPRLAVDDRVRGKLGEGKQRVIGSRVTSRTPVSRTPVSRTPVSRTPVSQTPASRKLTRKQPGQPVPGLADLVGKPCEDAVPDLAALGIAASGIAAARAATPRAAAPGIAMFGEGGAGRHRFVDIWPGLRLPR
jgi:hypothetical protein